jgi:DNA-binding transcriptional LysR family regulator
VTLGSIDINLLNVLHVVLSERSVARAARRLHVTPSAISNSLSRLRGVLGDPLVTRKGRGIVPTPRATELAPAIARGLRDLELAISAAPFDAASCARIFTLAMADAGQLAWLPRIAAGMLAVMPKAHLRVVGIDSLISLGDLTSSEIDLHIGIRGRGAGLHFEPLFEERLVLAARRRHPATSGRLSRRALEALHHVAVDLAPGRGFPDAVASAYARSGITRTVAITAPSFTAAAAIVAATDAVATLPGSLVRSHGARLGIRAIAGGPVPKHGVEIAMCWHERTHADPASMALRALVVRAIAEARAARSG